MFLLISIFIPVVFAAIGILTAGASKLGNREVRLAPRENQPEQIPKPEQRPRNDVFVANNNPINTAIIDLDSDSFQVRSRAIETLKEHLQKLITDSKFDELRGFITRLRELNPNLEVRARARSIVNPSDLQNKLNNIPLDKQRDYVNVLARTGIISEDVISENAAIRARGAERSSHPALLAFLARDPSISVKHAVAGNRNTASATLDTLVQEQDIVIWFCIASHSNASRPAITTALAGLAREPNNDIREYVSRHPDATADILAPLAHRDQAKNVRLNVAGHQNITPAIFTILLQDPDKDVRATAVRNPQITAALLSTAAGDQDRDVRLAVTFHRNTTDATLTNLLQDQEADVRFHAQNSLDLRRLERENRGNN